MNLAIITAHAGAECLNEAVNSWTNSTVMPLERNMRYPPESSEGGMLRAEIHLNPKVLIEDGQGGMLGAYQSGFQRTSDADILAFLHDDLIIHDKDWADRVLAEFEDPQVGLVGFGGALGHGSPSLYREPYDYHQLGRSDFLSNMDDAEAHGKRFTGSCDVAVLDGFALIVRREILGCIRLDPSPNYTDLASREVSGWPLNTSIGYACYDYWLSCMTRRLGYRIRLVGVSCHHLGGQTFVKLGIGKDPKHWEQYLASHEFIAQEFKDVLPWRVPQ